MVDDLRKAKTYLEKIAHETGDKFYGLITSSNISHDKRRVYLNNAKMIKQTDSKETIGGWFFRNSSKLDLVASEFVCQGLELNIPILYFAEDFIIDNGRWKVNPIKVYKKPEQTIRNIYRVLLSRGRIGLFIYLPREGNSYETIKFFESVGIEIL